MAGTILGTAPYMSPEQARGRAVDKRTDIWSFGCVLFEMLAGRRAFDGDDITETIAAIVKTEPDWTALPATTPPHLVSIVRGCLEKDPKRRFADIAVPLYLLTAPSAAATPAAAVAPPTPPWRRGLSVTAAVIVTAAITGAASWLLRPKTPDAPVMRFTIPLPPDQVLSGTTRKSIDLSPDGRRLVYAANRRLYIREMSDTLARPIAGTEFNAVGVPAFSPDGRQIAFYVNDDSSIKRIGIEGGSPVTVVAAPSVPFAIRWEQQGILIAQIGKGIVRVSPDGGPAQTLVAVPSYEAASSPESLPNGQGLLYSVMNQADSWDKGGRVMVLTPTGEKKLLLSGGSDPRYDGAGHLLYSVSGVTMAVPFDVRRLSVSGGAVPAIEGVARANAGGTSGSAQLSLASNGSLIYIPGAAKITDDSGDGRLAIFDEKGDIERLNLPPGTYHSPRVSPDGRSIAFESGGADVNVWVQDLTGNSASRRLTFGGHNTAPVWSSDNQWIAFQSDRDGDYAIFRQRADGSGVAERLTKPDKGTRHTPQSWSPDGKNILFTMDADAEYALAVLSLQDHTVRRFSDVRSAVRPESAFSPDGRWIVYQRSDTPAFTGIQVFVEPFPSTGAKYLVPVRGGHPFWSHNGDRLFFNTSALTSAVVDVKTAPTVTFSQPAPFPRAGRTEPNPATARRNVDTLPDGRLVGIASAGDGGANGATQFNVVLNWVPQLTAKLAH